MLQRSKFSLLDSHDPRRNVGGPESFLEVIPSDHTIALHDLESIPPSSGVTSKAVRGIHHLLTILIAIDQCKEVLDGADLVIGIQWFSSLDEGWG